VGGVRGDIGLEQPHQKRIGFDAYQKAIRIECPRNMAGNDANSRAQLKCVEISIPGRFDEPAVRGLEAAPPQGSLRFVGYQ
jgi:hypothetical protein